MSQTFKVLNPATDKHKDVHSTDQVYIDDALRSSFSGASAPTTPTPVPGQFFYDTTHKVLKQTNGSVWLSIPAVAKFTGTTESLGANGGPSDSTDIDFIHSLGVDDVLVMFQAKGDTSGNKWAVAIITPDGLSMHFEGIDANVVASLPAAPSAGKVTVRFQNRHTSSQTITYSMLIFSGGTP